MNRTHHAPTSHRPDRNTYGTEPIWSNETWQYRGFRGWVILTTGELVKTGATYWTQAEALADIHAQHPQVYL